LPTFLPLFLAAFLPLFLGRLFLAAVAARRLGAELVDFFVDMRPIYRLEG